MKGEGGVARSKSGVSEAPLVSPLLSFVPSKEKSKPRQETLASFLLRWNPPSRSLSVSPLDRSLAHPLSVSSICRRRSLPMLSRRFHSRPYFQTTRPSRLPQVAYSPLSRFRRKPRQLHAASTRWAPFVRHECQTKSFSFFDFIRPRFRYSPVRPRAATACSQPR